MTIRGVAHRGYSAKHPKNTRTAFQAALDLSFSHIELDVHLSRDGVPVVMHDHTVDRTTDASGPVRSFTAAQLQDMEVTGGERILLLAEAMELMAGDTTIMVELKQAGDMYPGLEEAALDVLRSTGTQEQALVISFDHFSISRLRSLDADVRLGLTSSCAMPYVIPFLQEMRCELMGVPTRMLTDEHHRMITAAGCVSGPWIVDAVEDMEHIRDRFPDALITTNELERWIHVVQDGATGRATDATGRATEESPSPQAVPTVPEAART